MQGLYTPDKDFSQDSIFEKKMMNILYRNKITNNIFFDKLKEKKITPVQLRDYIINFYHITEAFVLSLEELEKNIHLHKDIEQCFINKDLFQKTIAKIKKDEFAEFSKNPSPSEYHHNLLRRMGERLGAHKQDKAHPTIGQAKIIADYITTKFHSNDIVGSLGIIFVIESMAAPMFAVLKETTDSLRDGSVSLFTLSEKKRVDLHYILENEEHIGESHELIDCLTEKGKQILEEKIDEFSTILGSYWQAQSNFKRGILYKIKNIYRDFILHLFHRDPIRTIPLPF